MKEFLIKSINSDSILWVQDDGTVSMYNPDSNEWVEGMFGLSDLIALAERVYEIIDGQ